MSRAASAAFFARDHDTLINAAEMRSAPERHKHDAYMWYADERLRIQEGPWHLAARRPNFFIFGSVVTGPGAFVDREHEMAQVKRGLFGTPVYERIWEELPGTQRAVLQALAAGHRTGIQSELVRGRFRLGPHSTVQRALQLLRDRDIIDRDDKGYFFLEPLFGLWIRRSL